VKRLPDEPIVISGSADYGPEGIRSRDSLSLIVNEVEIEIDGLIKPVRGLFGSDVAFRAKGPSLAELIGFFAQNKAVPVQPYSLDGQLQIRADGYRFREVTGKVGTSDVEVDGLLVPRRKIVGSRFNFAARGAAFTEIIDQLGDLQVTPGPYELAGSIELEADVIKFDDIKLTRATGRVDLDLDLGMPVSRRWANLNLQASGPDVRVLLKTVENFEADAAPFLIDVTGKLRDTAWSLDNMDVNIGLASVLGKGTLDLRGETSATQFDLTVNVPNIGGLGTLDGYRMREQSFTLNANVTGHDNEVRIDNLRATLGQSDVRGVVRYRVGEVPMLDVLIESDAIEFSPLLEAGDNDVSTPEFDDGRVIPDVNIPFESMTRMNANVRVDIGELHRDTLYLRDIILRAELRDGSLELSEAGFQAASGALAARGRLEPNAGLGKAGFELVAREFATGISEQNRDLSMTGDIDLKLDSTGTDLRTLAGNASGVVFVDIRGGRAASNRFMQALFGDIFGEIIGAINPFSESEEYTDFECVILPIEINAGMLGSTPHALVATSKLRIVAKSEIDLKDELLVANIRTTPKKGISFSAGEVFNPYVKVVGTLAKPRLAVDEQGVLIAGSAAVATGGLSVLARAAWTRLSRAKDPCGELVAESKEELGGRFPDLTVEITQSPTVAPVEQPDQGLE
jgi:hypothetical protein